MPVLDILFSQAYVDYADIRTRDMILKIADQDLAAFFPSLDQIVTIDTPADHDNLIFSSVQDWLDYKYQDYVDNALIHINSSFGSIYTQGEMVVMPQPIDDAIKNRQPLHAKLTSISGLSSMAAGKMMYATGADSFGLLDTSTYGRGLVNLANQGALQTSVGVSTAGLSGAYSDLSGKPSLSTVATSGDYNDLSNKPSIPSVARTTSALSLSLVGTGATGTQISSTKDSTVKCTVSTSTTSTIGGPATSIVALKICSANDSTEANWTTVATFESDQTVTLAIALQCVQVVKGQICADIPAGWYVKLVNSGTGTHSESFVSGQKTIFG